MTWFDLTALQITNGGVLMFGAGWLLEKYVRAKYGKNVSSTLEAVDTLADAVVDKIMTNEPKARMLKENWSRSPPPIQSVVPQDIHRLEKDITSLKQDTMIMVSTIQTTIDEMKNMMTMAIQHEETASQDEQGKEIPNG